MDSAFDLQLARIQQKISQTPGVRLNPPAVINQIEVVERDHNILLPPAYRRFLLEVGDGGWLWNWPLYSLAKAISIAEGPLSSPFPFTGNWSIDEQVEASLMDEQLEYDLSGALPIFYFGCTHSDFLIMNGPYAGTVMYDGRGTDQGYPPYTVDSDPAYLRSNETVVVSKRLDYLGWFESKLDNGLL